MGNEEGKDSQEEAPPKPTGFPPRRVIPDATLQSFGERGGSTFAAEVRKGRPREPEAEE